MYTTGSFFWLFEYLYVDVGCTTQNEVCHLYFGLLYANLKFTIGHKEGTIMMMCWQQHRLHVTFDSGLELTYESMFLLAF